MFVGGNGCHHTKCKCDACQLAKGIIPPPAPLPVTTSDDDDDVEQEPLANSRNVPAPTQTGAASGSNSDRAREDYLDLLSRERSGISVIMTNQQDDEPIIVTEMPMANHHVDRLEDEAEADAAGNCGVEWVNRRGELNDMWELEQTGQSVVWQDPRIA